MNPAGSIGTLLQMCGLVAIPLLVSLLLAGATAAKRRCTSSKPFIPAQRGGERRA